MSMEIDNLVNLHLGRHLPHVMVVNGWRPSPRFHIDWMEERVTMPAKTFGFTKSAGFGWHVMLDTREDSGVPFQCIWTYACKMDPAVGVALQQILDKEGLMNEEQELAAYQQNQANLKAYWNSRGMLP